MSFILGRGQANEETEDFVSPKNDPHKSKGFTDEERAAMKARAQELKEDERAKKDKAEGESALLAAIAAMPEPDRAMATRLHTITQL